MRGNLLFDGKAEMTLKERRIFLMGRVSNRILWIRDEHWVGRDRVLERLS